MGIGTSRIIMPGKRIPLHYVPEQYRANFGDQSGRGSVAANSKESLIGPLPVSVETSQVLAQTALRGAVTIKEDTMSEQHPSNFDPLVQDVEAKERLTPQTFNVPSSWPAGELALGTEPPEEQ